MCLVGNSFIVQRPGHSAVVSVQGGDGAYKGHCAWTAVEIRCELKARGKFETAHCLLLCTVGTDDGKGSLRMENERCSSQTTAICWRTRSSVFLIPRQARSADTDSGRDEQLGKSYEMEFSFNDTDDKGEFARSASKLGCVYEVDDIVSLASFMGRLVCPDARGDEASCHVSRFELAVACVRNLRVYIQQEDAISYVDMDTSCCLASGFLQK